MTVVRPPWSDLPPSLAVSLREHLPAVTAAVVAAVPLEVPRYARPIEGRFGQGLRQGVGVALGRFLDLPGTDASALRADEREVYVALGRGELRQGRELEALLSAYRVGSRVAFRELANLAQAAGADADVLVLLAEAVFAYMDELSSASVEGYAFEQTLQAGESGRLRNAVLGLLAQPGVDAAALDQAVRRTGWGVPAGVVAVVVPAPLADGLAGALGPTALVGELHEVTVALVPAPRTAPERDRLHRALVGRQAVVGPPRAWESAGVSLRLARLAARVLPGGAEPVDVTDRVPHLLLRAAPELMDDLAARVLAPLATVRPTTAERLAETLLCWLRHRGERQKVAAELHVHTQTVGYRLGQLRDLFGDVLEEPEGRFELELALRYRVG